MFQPTPKVGQDGTWHEANWNVSSITNLSFKNFSITLTFAGSALLANCCNSFLPFCLIISKKIVGNSTKFNDLLKLNILKQFFERK